MINHGAGSREAQRPGPECPPCARPHSRRYSIGAGEIALLLYVAEERIACGPGLRPCLGQFTEPFEDADAVSPKACGNRLAVGKMSTDGLEPDRPPRKKSPGSGGIGIIEHALELVARCAP